MSKPNVIYPESKYQMKIVSGESGNLIIPRYGLSENATIYQVYRAAWIWLHMQHFTNIGIELQVDGKVKITKEMFSDEEPNNNLMKDYLSPNAESNALVVYYDRSYLACIKMQLARYVLGVRFKMSAL